MIDLREVIEHCWKPALELLSEFPGVGYCGCGVVEDVAYEVQSGDLSRYGGALDDQGTDDNVDDLGTK